MADQEKKETSQREKAVIVFFSVVVELVLVAVFCVVPFLIPVLRRFCWEIFSFGIFANIVAALYFVYFRLAPNNISFTFMKEGTAKIITKGEAVADIFIQFSGRILDGNWNVVQGRSRRRLLGGLRFYGIWPFSDIYTYRFSWTSRRQGGELSEHKKELLDYILLTADVYFGKVEKAETADLLPTDVEFLIGAKIVNPFKTAYEIQDWLEAVMSRFSAVIKSALTERFYEEWINSKGNDLSKRIWEDHQTQELVSQSANLYGVEITSVDVLKIDPGEEFRKQTLSKYVGERASEKMVVETAEATIKMMAATSGITPEEMKEQIKKDPKKRKELRRWVMDMRAQKQALDGGGFKRFDFNGLPAGGSSFMGAAAVIADALSNKSGGGKQSGVEASIKGGQDEEQRKKDKKALDELEKRIREGENI